MNKRCQKENYVKRIRKTLFILWVARPRWVKEPPVITRLNLLRHIDRVRIFAVQQNFAGADPTGIKIGKISPRRTGRISRGALEWHQYAEAAVKHQTEKNCGSEEEWFAPPSGCAGKQVTPREKKDQHTKSNKRHACCGSPARAIWWAP